MDPASGLVLVSGGTEILNTGTFDIAADDYTDLFEEYGAGGIFVNRGTFVKSGRDLMPVSSSMQFGQRRDGRHAVGTLGFGPGLVECQ